MREDYICMDITTEREPIITETIEELNKLYDDVLTSLDTPQHQLED